VESVAAMPPNNRVSQRMANAIYADARLFLKRKKIREKSTEAVGFTIMSI